MGISTIAGTLTYPIAVGSDVSIVLGAPLITPTSTTGAQLTFTEHSTNNYLVTAAASPVTIPVGTLTDIDVLYIGTDEALTYTINGGSEVFNLAAGGFVLVHLGSYTALAITAVALDATVTVAMLGS